MHYYFNIRINKKMMTTVNTKKKLKLIDALNLQAYKKSCIISEYGSVFSVKKPLIIWQQEQQNYSRSLCRLENMKEFRKMQLKLQRRVLQIQCSLPKSCCNLQYTS